MQLVALTVIVIPLAFTSKTSTAVSSKTQFEETLFCLFGFCQRVPCGQIPTARSNAPR